RLLANFAKRVIFFKKLDRKRTMPTRNINLTDEQDSFVEKIVQAGEYQNASEAVRDALRALQQRRKEDAMKLKRLRALLKAGIDELERGEYLEFDDVGRKEFLEKLATSPGKTAT